MYSPRVLLLACCLMFFSCTSKKEEGVLISDATLFNLAKTVSSFTYLKNSTDTLPVAGNSPHGSFVRVRFNQMSVAAMNDSVTRLSASSFPDESMIVKEVYGHSGGQLLMYAIMYKMSGAANSSSGWVWSEFLPDGTTVYSSINKGDQCVSCHIPAGNNDRVQSFRYH